MQPNVNQGSPGELHDQDQSVQTTHSDTERHESTSVFPFETAATAITHPAAAANVAQRHDATASSSTSASQNATHGPDLSIHDSSSSSVTAAATMELLSPTTPGSLSSSQAAALDASFTSDEVAAALGAELPQLQASSTAMQFPWHQTRMAGMTLDDFTVRGARAALAASSREQGPNGSLEGHGSGL